MADVVLAILILSPAVTVFFLKSSGALAFLSVCAGYVACTLAGNNLAELINKSGLRLKNTDVDLLFLIAPLVLTLMFTAKAHMFQTKRIMQTVAGFGAGALLALTATPFLSISTGLDFSHSQIWPVVQSAQSYIVGLGALYALILVWFFNGQSHKKHK